MDAQGKIVWFYLSAEDVARAANFYNSVFGWTLTPMFDDPDMRLIATSDGSQIGMVMKRMAPAAPDETSPNTTIFIEIESFKDCFQAASVLGGKVLLQPESIPGDDVSGFAHINDSEGNIIGVVAPMSTAPELDAVAAQA